MADSTERVMVVITTLDDGPAAERLVEALVEERLIACGSIVPGVVSIYPWQGKVARESEVLVVMKTAGPRLDELIARAAELHPYDVPELLALPVDGGFAPYCRWVMDETSEVSA